jgi:endoglycosylceramidase
VAYAAPMRSPASLARLAALACLLGPTTGAHASGVLHAEGGFFRDSTGAVVILRGVDAAGNSKVPPFTPLADPRTLDPLPGWGFNVLRLLFNWEAYQPDAPDVFDDAYLGYYQSVVAAAASRGLYVIVDFHQDAFSRYAEKGCGEGFPKWALPPTVTAATPDNSAACANWGQAMYGDPDLQASWDAFYADSYGVRTRYLAMIARVADSLKNDFNVVGYDLLNEPYGDEKTQIGPLYADAAKAIRAVDPDALLFVSPAGVTSAGNSSNLDKPAFGNFAYSPHYYDPTLFLFHGWGGSDETMVFADMTGTAQRFGAPLFLGEFGATPATDLVDAYLGTMATRLDEALASSAQWVYTPGWTPAAKDGWNAEDFSIVDDHGELRANFRPRPYARRIAGTPTSLTVSDLADAQKNTLALTWQNDPGAGATELFVPAAYFGGHAIVYVDEGGSCATDGDIVRCSVSGSGTRHLHARAPSKSCGLTGMEAILVLAALRRVRRRR